jgi:hypothetical protein
MISYCVAAYRPVYARLLLDDLVKKTTSPYEILVWDNSADEAFARELDRLAAGVPLRVIGRTPKNIGMRAYTSLLRAARYPLIVQIDDDVLCVSRGIAERASAIFASRPDVGQLVADVWQDDLTTGARPPLSHYTCVDERHGLYDGPIDGWFSIYHRSILPLVLSIPLTQYCFLGAAVRARLRSCGRRGLLCRAMRVFHAIGPAYASLFGMLDFEIAKYRRLGRAEIVHWYETEPRPARDEIQARFAEATASLDPVAMEEPS